MLDVMSIRYIHTTELHNTKAAREVIPFIMELLHPRSIIDVGCGIGTWLKVFEEHGISDYLGIDGDYIDIELLHIDRHKFITQNLENPAHLERRFDLVVSLEVAEHIAEQSSDKFVDFLVSLGDIILFSAAIPDQGGQNHLNEQWPLYWQEKFRDHGYHFCDILRSRFWDDEDIDWWYRQNMFLVVNSSLREQFPESHNIMKCIHPKQYKYIHDKLMDIHSGNLSITDAIKILCKSFLHAMKQFLIRYYR